MEEKTKNRLPLYIAAVCAVVLVVAAVGYFNCWLGHTWDEGTVTAEATHVSIGVKTYTCSVCGQIQEEITDKLPEHTYDRETISAQYLKSEATCTAPAEYYKSCECGEAGTETFTYGEANGHTWDNGTVTVEATYTTAGTRIYTCTACGQTKEEVIPRLADSGTCGANLTWVLDVAGTLTISGSGEMSNFEYNFENENAETPWKAYNGSILKVVLEEGITSLGDFAFCGCVSLTSVTIPDGVTDIGSSVFNGCISLTTVDLPDSVTTMGDTVFWACSSLTTITIPSNVTAFGESPLFNR